MNTLPQFRQAVKHVKTMRAFTASPTALRSAHHNMVLFLSRPHLLSLSAPTQSAYHRVCATLFPPPLFCAIVYLFTNNHFATPQDGEVKD